MGPDHPKKAKGTGATEEKTPLQELGEYLPALKEISGDFSKAASVIKQPDLFTTHPSVAFGGIAKCINLAARALSNSIKGENTKVQVDLAIALVMAHEIDNDCVSDNGGGSNRTTGLFLDRLRDGLGDLRTAMQHIFIDDHKNSAEWLIRSTDQLGTALQEFLASDWQKD